MLRKGNREKGNMKGREDEHSVTQVVTRNGANKHVVRTRRGGGGDGKGKRFGQKGVET